MQCVGLLQDIDSRLSSRLLDGWPLELREAFLPGRPVGLIAKDCERSDLIERVDLEQTTILLDVPDAYNPLLNRRKHWIRVTKI